MNNTGSKVKNTCESLWNVELVLFGMIGHKSLRRAFGSEEYHIPIREIIISICSACFLTMCVSSSTRTFFTVGFEDLSVTGEVISGLLSGFLIFIRITRFASHKNAFFSILRDFHILWEDVKTLKHLRSEIDDIINSTKPPRYLYLGSAVILGLVYALPPYGAMLIGFFQNGPLEIDYSMTIYPLNYAFPHDTDLSYNLCLIYEAIVDYLVTIYWVACDITFIQLTTHLRIHILALSNNFTLESYDADEIHEYFTVNRISNLAKRHEHLMRLCKQVENLFNPIFFFTILFNGIDLCCCIIMLDREATEGDWRKFAKSVTHAITLFIQIVIYCDFAHQTSELLNNIAPTIFNSPWAFCDKKVQQLLAIIMMRANKEYKFMAYGILNLDREQMTRVCI
ncbi:GSCOCT00005075001.3-RA-CDS [Cotesia congregata]|uniref:Odorant receptor n=1 Tax=Cotesia congregata TaxID=51543 RepID=A0A8J2HHD2_COTCN|nr:GSCOCT00005075001.3-RA-CDS [Cotesia congregata]CAG5101251.1 olfactory receptor 130 [Cotesia congregata]